MSSFAELKNSFYASLYERMSSPLIGTYVLSWLVWNWKVVYALVNPTYPYFEKGGLTYINTHLNLLWHFNSHIVPLCSTVILVLAIPRLNKYVFQYTEGIEAQKRNIRQNFADESLLTKVQLGKSRQQTEAMEQRIADMEERYKTESEHNQNDIESLRLRLSNAESKYSGGYNTGSKEDMDGYIGILILISEDSDQEAFYNEIILDCGKNLGVRSRYAGEKRKLFDQLIAINILIPFSEGIPLIFSVIDHNGRYVLSPIGQTLHKIVGILLKNKFGNKRFPF